MNNELTTIKLPYYIIHSFNHSFIHPIMHEEYNIIACLVSSEMMLFLLFICFHISLLKHTETYLEAKKTNTFG